MTYIARVTRIDLPEDTKASSIDCLNDNLANTLFAVLASKFAHWNVKGTGFFPAHQLFDKVYEFYSNAADIIGERITALGGVAEGLLTNVAGNSSIVYEADATDTVSDHMIAMADMLGIIANGYREGVEMVNSDKLTQDVFIELGREADKLLYFLESDLS